MPPADAAAATAAPLTWPSPAWQKRLCRRASKSTPHGNVLMPLHRLWKLSPGSLLDEAERVGALRVDMPESTTPDVSWMDARTRRQFDLGFYRVIDIVLVDETSISARIIRSLPAVGIFNDADERSRIRAILYGLIESSRREIIAAIVRARKGVRSIASLQTAAVVA